MRVALNYYPKRHDTSQPCIDKINSIIIMILNELYGYSLAAATEFIQNNVVYLNRSPFAFAYKTVEADKAVYNKLLSETDGPMTEVFTQIVKMMPNLKAMITMGEGPFHFFPSLFPEYVNQEEACPHPQIPVKSQATEKQRRTIVEHFTDALSEVTGVEPRGQLTKVNLDKIIFVSPVTAAERVAKAVKTRARNKSVLDAARSHIRIMSPEVDVSAMNINDCADWLIDDEKVKKQAAKEEAREKKEKRKLAKAEKLAQAKAEKLAQAERAKEEKEQDKADAIIVEQNAITQLESSAVLRSLASSGQVFDDEEMRGMMNHRRKRNGSLANITNA